jgi:transcriptional regulator with XRE-family HTH domain
MPVLDRNPSFSKRLQRYREENDLTPADLAAALGVSRATIYRWENGTARPSRSMVACLDELGAPLPAEDELNTRSIPRLKEAAGMSAALSDLREASVRGFRFGGEDHECLPAPYVRNGPPDQMSFHETLIDLQEQDGSSMPWDVYRRRLALVETVGGTPTAQHLLEARRETALSWNSNYGSHGWHRYVGRFPPHLVRALLNSWDLTEADLVLDPFAGSGTTLVECRLLGIPAVGIELCPLSAMMSRAKVGFPADPESLRDLPERYEAYYARRMRGRRMRPSAASIFKRFPCMEPFSNAEKWFSPEAFLGVAITVDFACTLSGYEQDFLLTALSARMRSIGNVDVDVVRAEYRKTPREDVDVQKLVAAQVRRMIASIRASVASHDGLMERDARLYDIVHSSVLDARLDESSVSAIVTSPPYGVESLSYLRTHLLSYRSLKHFLGADPYERHEAFIGSEYVDGGEMEPQGSVAWDVSPTFEEFFAELAAPRDRKRHAMMVKFFDGLARVAERMHYWLVPGGHVGFVVGNKRLGERIIPTDAIVTEIFAAHGLAVERVVEHKLKTNNSNSQVPWQERIIQNEFVMMFKAE